MGIGWHGIDGEEQFDTTVLTFTIYDFLAISLSDFPNQVWPRVWGTQAYYQTNRSDFTMT